MELQRLTIHNIASVEDAVIDFDKGPLSDSDVFLITGKTGSGKSTILDAICLALYSSTPRLKNTSMQGDVLDGDKTVKINDPRQLMRRNTGEAFVKLAFVGNDGIPYESEWSVSRARKKPAGNLQSKKWALTDLKNGVTYDKDDDIRPIIHNAVGLDFSQFCRTTLLAQGEFTRFLNSKDEDKAAILEKITGVNVYSTIGKKIYEITATKQSAVDRIERQIGDVILLQPEQIASYEKEREDIGAEYTRYQGIKSVLENKKRILEVISECRRELEAADVRKEELFVRYKAVAAGKRKIDADISLCKTQIAAAEEYISNEEKRSKAIKGLQAILADLRLIYDAHNVISRENAKITEGRRLLDGEIREAETASVLMQTEARLAHENQKKILDEKEKALSGTGLPDLRAAKEKLIGRRNDLSIALTRLHTVETERQRASKRIEDLGTQQNMINELNIAASAYPARLKEAEMKKDVCAQMLERHKDSVNLWAKSIRTKLSDGDICPVCGQVVLDTAFDEEAMDMLFRQSEEAYNAAVKEHEAIKGEADSLNARLSQARMNLERSTILHQEDKSLENALGALVEACNKIDLNADIENIAEIIQIFETENEESIAKLTDGIVSAEILEKECRDSRKILDRLTEAKQKADENVTEVLLRKSQCEAGISASRTVIAAKEKDIETSSVRIDAMVNQEDWQNDWKTDMTAFARELKEVAASYDFQVSEKTRLSSSLEAAVTESGHLEQTIGKIHELNPGWKERLSDEAYAFNGRILDAAGMLLAESVSLEDRRTQNLTRRAEAEKALKILSENEAWTDEFPDTESIMLKIKETDTLMFSSGERNGEVQKILEDDRINKERQGKLLEEKETLRADHEKWNRLNMLIGDATGKKFRQIAQSYILSNLIASANSYMKTLTDRYTLKVTPGTFVIMIEDAYQGYASRAASTISGGESFLVSLSLALALSDIGQKLAVDILFIDEGFGTLSGEPLQNAISTLKSLHRKAGRRVGIISHVEELRERIPVQIRVNQEGNNSASMIEVI